MLFTGLRRMLESFMAAETPQSLTEIAVSYLAAIERGAPFLRRARRGESMGRRHGARSALGLRPR